MSYGVDRTAALRWAVLTLALAAAVGLSAYWTALASRPVEEEPPATPQARPAPGFVPIDAARGHALATTARDRAYRRGRRAGFREGKRAAARSLRRRLGGFSRWTPGIVYVVTSARDGKGIAGRAPLEPGASYSLCPGGRKVCVKPPG